MWFLILLSIIGILYGLMSMFKFDDIEFKLPGGKIIGIVSTFIFIITLLITKIGGQDVGILITPRGVSDDELHTGWHLIMPWNNVQTMDKTVWVYSFSNKISEGQKKDADAIWTPTKDGIKMGLDISISWRIDPDYASWIYANISENDGGETGRYLWIEENVIRPKTKSSLALTVSDYTPIEVYSNKRREIQEQVYTELKKDLSNYHIILEQIDIREVFYNEEYEKAINNKKLAEQEALRLIEITKQKQELLTQAKIDKDIQITAAQGESESLRIKGNSITTNPKIIELEWINKWNGVLPTYMLGNNTGLLISPK